MRQTVCTPTQTLPLMFDYQPRVGLGFKPSKPDVLRRSSSGWWKYVYRRIWNCDKRITIAEWKTRECHEGQFIREVSIRGPPRTLTTRFCPDQTYRPYSCVYAACLAVYFGFFISVSAYLSLSVTLNLLVCLIHWSWNVAFLAALS